jgi:hypothetical protein
MGAERWGRKRGQNDGWQKDVLKDGWQKEGP